MNCSPKETEDSGSQLMLFVTGIPSKSKAHEILAHFTTYGHVQLYKLGSKNDGNKVMKANPASNIKRGFCILLARDLKSFRNVLNSANVLFQGRTLAISRFRQGRELYEYNQYVNSRRVILKKVPINIDQNLLRLFIESEYGKLSRIYCYQAESKEKASRKNPSRKSHTYSAEFDSIQDADKLAKCSFIYLPGGQVKIQVEKFNRKPSSLETNFILGEEVPGIGLLNHDTDGREMTIPQFETFSESRLDSQNHHNGVGINQERSDIRCHFLKPTSRMYFEKSTTIKLRNTVKYQNGLRFNLQKGTNDAEFPLYCFRKRLPLKVARETPQQKGGLAH